jgi:transcriptional regulator with XRE-family HTH domain
MEASADLRTQRDVAKRSGLDQTTVGRMKRGSHSPQLKHVEAVAAAFGLQAWQLLVPGLDPKNPPVCELTTIEKELYDKLRGLVKQLPPRLVALSLTNRLKPRRSPFVGLEACLP